MYLNIRVLGMPIILCREDDAPPDDKHRIGSVPVKFPNGDSFMVRVFGHTPILEQYEHRVTFERELRLIVEEPSTIKVLFGLAVEGVRTTRFNPSQSQRQRGWVKHHVMH